MITLFTPRDLLVQIHRNHVARPLQSPVSVVLRGVLNGEEIRLDNVPCQELRNCYLLSLGTPNLNSLGLNATLALEANGDTVYQSALTLRA